MQDIATTYPHVRHCRVLTTPAGTTWGPRVIPDFELILIVQGRHHYIDKRGCVPAEPGDIITIEPEREHVFECVAANRQEGMHICTHFDLLDRNGFTTLIPQLTASLQRRITVDDFAYTRMLFEQAARNFAQYSKLHTDIVDATVRLIWLQIIQKWSTKRDENISGVLDDMIAYVRTHFAQPISRRDIAEHVGYTPEHVNYLFKKELGITPSRYINRERVTHAFNLLYEQQISVQEAAERSGFANPYYFSRVFKEIFGHSPGRIKKYFHREIDHFYGTYKPSSKE